MPGGAKRIEKSAVDFTGCPEMHDIGTSAVIEGDLAFEELLEGGSFVGGLAHQVGAGRFGRNGDDAITAELAKDAGDAVDVIGAVALETLIEREQDVHRK
jgi:hypothetical protein